MKLIKKIPLKAYLFPVSAMLALVALIVSAVSCSDPAYSIAQLPAVIALSIIVILIGIGICFVALKLNDGPVLSVMMAAMILLTAGCIWLMFAGKSLVFGSVLFSDLEKGYAPAERACYMGIAGIVIYAVSACVAIVATFFKIQKQEEEAE